MGGRRGDGECFPGSGWGLQHPFRHEISHPPEGYCKISASRGTGNTWLQTQGTIKSTRFGRAGPQPCCPSPPSPSYLLLSLLSSFQQAVLFRLAFPSLESLPTLSSLTPPFSFLHLRLLLSFLTFLLRAGFLSLSGSSRFTPPRPHPTFPLLSLLISPSAPQRRTGV